MRRHRLPVTTTTATVIAIAIVGSGALAACSDGTTTVAATTSSSVSDELSADSGAYGSECSPVGTSLASEVTETVAIQLADYAFVPTTLEVSAGVVSFEASNIGDQAHELAVLPGGGDVPFTNGAPDEGALADAGAFELEAFPAGESCEATFRLEPGDYTLFCIVEAPDGQTHYEKGMTATMTVS